ncbi:MAG: RnfABCDGE type electron transport complex subunit D, partial [Clostridia bacterium]|nr:RnfABCDGE type electron transport complex subunit D [Clostridia bacterium]
MKTFPLIRTKWTNEHVMAALFGVLLLYLIPMWMEGRSGVLSFLAVLGVGFAIDVSANLIRYKRPVCSVSAAITTAVMTIATPGAPLWAQLLGTTAALIFGKHIWGGTGKNPVNPAMIGLVVVCILTPVAQPMLSFSWLLLPALLLSLPFAVFRPYASVSFSFGMVLALVVFNAFSLQSFATYGVIFWSCVVITDPVTATPSKAIGSVGALITGFLALFLSGSVLYLGLGVLAFNVLSYACQGLEPVVLANALRRNRIKKFLVADPMQVPFVDLVGDKTIRPADTSNLTSAIILERIRTHEVFGQGGAAFPTFMKLQTVIDSKAQDKYLIINGAECDPGLIHDQWLMHHHAEELLKAVALLKSCVPFKSTVLALKRPVAALEGKGLTVVTLPDFYPVGAERVVIGQVLGKRLSVSQIPAKEGYLVLNVQTLYTIYEAVCLDKKADSRFLTVADYKTKVIKVARVKLGASIEKTLETVLQSYGPSFAGGGAMQSRAVNEEDVIDKNVNFIARAPYPAYKESKQCSKCGFCQKGCPGGLRVNQIADLVDAGKIGETKRYQVEACIQCGSC